MSIVVLFTLLIVWTTRWTVIDAKSLNDNPLNHRTLIDELQIKRGRILADDGTVLAESVPAPGATYGRRYPTGPKFSQAVGYSYLHTGRLAGLEDQYRDQLRGLQTGLSSVFGQLGGRSGSATTSTRRSTPRPSRWPINDLAGREGSVVALDPSTGAIKVMYSNPTYDDNNAGQWQHVRLRPPGPASPGLDVQGRDHDGARSTPAPYTPNSMINGNSPQTISGVPLNNDLNQSFGVITLTDALTQSVNTVFAQVAVSLGIATMTDVHEALRLLRQAAARLTPPARWTAPSPTAPTGPYPPAAPTRTSAASPSARAGCW